jgi:5,6-dimethylbenzimidazole synthase
MMYKTCGRTAARTFEAVNPKPSASPAPTFDDAFFARLRELVRWRRDVRHFRRDPLPPGCLADLVADAALAPSVGYSQPWRFVAVDDRARRAAIVANFERCNADALAAYAGDRRAAYASLKLAGLREAPAHLAVFLDEATSAGSGLGRRTAPEMLAYSVVGAVVTFWLLARARGIGVGWVSILDHGAAARDLDVEPSWRLVAYLCVGYPLDVDDVPELSRAGWERAVPAAAQILQR